MFTKFLPDARVTFICTLVLALYTICVLVAAHYVDKATAHQCANHLWPAEAHAVHIEWCTDNGYEVR